MTTQIIDYASMIVDGVLHLGGTGVTDVSPLAGLTKLQVLYLNGTGVTDVSPLAGLTELWWLDLSGTGVADTQVAEFKKQHPTCSVLL